MHRARVIHRVSPDLLGDRPAVVNPLLADSRTETDPGVPVTRATLLCAIACLAGVGCIEVRSDTTDDDSDKATTDTDPADTDTDPADTDTDPTDTDTDPTDTDTDPTDTDTDTDPEPLGSKFDGAAIEWALPTGASLTQQDGFAELNHRSYSDVYNTIDINGDGLADLVQPTNPASSQDKRTVWGWPAATKWRVYLNNGAGFDTTAMEWPVPSGDANTEQNGFAELNFRLNNDVYNTIDIDGDGLVDLVQPATPNATGDVRTVWGHGSSPKWRVYLNNGAGFDTTAIEWPVPAGDDLVEQNGFAELNFRLNNDVYNTIDINGDGRIDLVQPTDPGATDGARTVWSFGVDPHWKVYLNNGAGFDTTAVEWSVPDGGDLMEQNGFAELNVRANNDVVNTVDVNGDGLPDLVQPCDPASGGARTVWGFGGSAYWKVYLNNGAGFDDTHVQWAVPPGTDLTDQNGYAEMSFRFDHDVYNTTDINGDGMLDLVQPTNSGAPDDDRSVWGAGTNPHWRVYLNTGSGFSVNPTAWSVPLGDDLTEQNGFAEMNARMNFDVYNTVDLNGDGRLDLVHTTDPTGAGNRSPFDYPASPHWRVYLNTP